MLIMLGNYSGKIKINWFIGTGTPRTMSSEDVWNKTNRMGGWMLILFGLIIIAAPYLPQVVALVLFVLGILSLILGSFV